jgi:hypothetical protein
MLRDKHSALSAFFKRMKAKKGFLHAMKATARLPARLQRGKQQAGKIAVIYYRIMTKGIAFVERGIELYQQQFQEQQLRLLQKKAHALGLQLIPA